MSFFAELKRRNVFRVAVAYVVIGWLLMQVAEVLVPALRLPDWILSATIYFLMIGFLPAIIFAWAFELTPDGIRKEADVDRSQSIAHNTGRKLDYTIIALLLVVVGFMIFDQVGGKALAPEPDQVSLQEDTKPAQAEAGNGGDPGAEAEEAQGPPEKSIAVLPFANMSEDAGNEFFADGISEEILNALAKVRELKVAGRTSSFAFKGRNEDLRLIGQTLDVSHILEGSVRKAGNTVRVTAQLIKVEDGYHLWSETYDRELTDIFAIQDEIANSILTELKAELIGEEKLVSAQTDPRAYEKYLRAKQLAYLRKTEPLTEARDLLDEAIELDENFAPAWAQRGIISALLSQEQYGDIPPADAEEQLRRYAEHALRLDENLAEGWAGLGLYQNQQGSEENTQKAIVSLKRALEINPSLLDAANWLTSAYLDNYQIDKSAQLMEQIVDRDPLYYPALGNLSFTYLRLNQNASLKHQLDRVRPILGGQPSFSTLETMYLLGVGKYADALKPAKAAWEGSKNEAFQVGAYGRALFFINEFEGSLEINWADAEFTAQALDYLGRPEEAHMNAMRWFELSNNPVSTMQSMVHQENYPELIQFVNERWGGLEGFHEQVGMIFGFGHRPMLSLAKAYLETGQEEEFSKSMQLIRDEHDRQLDQGAKWGVFQLMEARYWTMAEDQEKAIDHLESMVDGHHYAVPRFSHLYPILKPLEGNPRYEAVQARALENLNRERVKAGLKPLAPAYTL